MLPRRPLQSPRNPRVISSFIQVVPVSLSRQVGESETAMLFSSEARAPTTRARDWAKGPSTRPVASVEVGQRAGRPPIGTVDVMFFGKL